MTSPIEAVLFDAYGTLLTLDERAFARDGARVVGGDRRRWAAALRLLLTRAFDSPDALVADVCARFPAAGDPGREALGALLAAELASARALPGAHCVPAFLRRRGLRLGLVSNASSAHKQRVASLGLLEPIEACAWSCDEARVKPDPALFLEICRRLDVDPARTLVIGDSRQNDVQAPRQLGMHALHVGPAGLLSGVALLAFRDLAGGPPFRELLPAGTSFRMHGVVQRLEELTLLPDAEQGRYNLVARAHARDAAGQVRTVYVKRFLHPEAGRVEELMHHLHRLVGVSACDVAIAGDPEPCLVATPAPGHKLADASPTPELAFEFGRQCALGYLFANADLRPRNAFLHAGEYGPVVTMVDLEHGLFNLALDSGGLRDPLDPRCWDAATDDELRARVRRQVLSAKATRRARRTFLADDDRDSPCGRAFHEGWTTLYRQVQRCRESVLSALHERAYADRPLVVGTLGHRRAFCRLDIADVDHRIGQDPEQVFGDCY